MDRVKLCIIGAGDRGRGYSQYAKDYPEQVQVVAVAEPREFYRDDLAQKHRISPENTFETWQQVVDCDRKVADAVIIATQDDMHVEPALALMEKGYHVLLEKPMATIKTQCMQIAEAAIKNQVIFSVCHVLRYTPYTQALKQILDSGKIGEIVSIQHLEPVGFDHFAHSFVRGNWRNQTESSFLLMTKACHDLDWIRYIVDSKITAVSSFGNLKHFTSTHKPAGSDGRCCDCGVESECPYSAVKIYLDRARAGYFEWPVDILTSDLTVAGVQQAIETGPYGRCVYDCDNDVVDHQVVNMEFESGVTGTLTVTAFTERTSRRTRIFGTRGEIAGDGKMIDCYDFQTQSHRIIDTSELSDSMPSGHGGGDYGLMKNFVEAVTAKNQSLVLSGPQESLEAYLAVFGAEEARKNNSVVNIYYLDQLCVY